jgi:hypothetical protein
MVFEQGVHSVQEFTHEGKQSLHFGITFREQVLIEAVQVWAWREVPHGGRNG